MAKDNGQFVKLPMWLLQRADISGNAKIVYAAIADHVGKNGRAWPGMRRLGRETGLHLTTINRAIANLAEHNLLTVTRRNSMTGPRRDRSNVYIPHTLNVREPLTLAKRERMRIANTNVSELLTEPDQRNQTKVTKRARRAWETAQESMTSGVLDTEEFKMAFGEWEQFRHETGKDLTATTIRRQIRMLEGLGHNQAIETVGKSILNGWQGLFPRDKANGKTKRTGTGRRPAELAERIEPQDYRAPEAVADG